MKKYGVVAALLLVYNNAFAAAYDEFYARAEAGLGYYEKNQSASNESKLKNTRAFVGSLALGTNIQPNLRAELMASNISNATEKCTGKATVTGFNTSSEKQKLRSQRLLLRVLPDFYDFGYGKLYGIGGIGISRISNSASITLTNAAGATTTEFSKVKPKYVPSFTLGAGTGFYLNESLIVDLSYYYLYESATRSKEIHINGKQIQTGKIKFNSHNVGLGLRLLFN